MGHGLHNAVDGVPILVVSQRILLTGSAARRMVASRFIRIGLPQSFDIREGGPHDFLAVDRKELFIRTEGLVVV